MKLFLLRPIIHGAAAWNPWYDKSHGFVIRAENEEEARKMASEARGDEGKEPWLDHEQSKCIDLLNEGGPGIVLQRL